MMAGGFAGSVVMYKNSWLVRFLQGSELNNHLFSICEMVIERSCGKIRHA